MPSIRFTSPDDPKWVAREKLIEEVLPKEPIISSKISDGSFIITRKELTEALIKEIGVYKAFPREGKYSPDTFNPRNSKECFMGQGFTANGNGFEGWTDYDLARYRKAVGTLTHKTWGTCTLLEIWGGDHFEKYQKMVKNVFLFCNGDLKTMPKVKFWINPLYANNLSGTWDPHAEEVWENLNREHIEKLANYCEIRDRMKKAKVKSCMDLAIKEEDDPKPIKRTRNF